MLLISMIKTVVQIKLPTPLPRNLFAANGRLRVFVVIGVHVQVWNKKKIGDGVFDYFEGVKGERTN